MCVNSFCALLLYNLVHETYIITGFFVQIPAISPGASGSSSICPADTVLLETRMRYGEISYHNEDVLKWKERWQPSERLENDLRMDHQKKPEVKVRFYSDKYGRVQCTVIETTPGRSTRLKNYLCFCLALLWNPLCFCFACLWNRLFPFRPRLRGTVTGTTPGCLTRFKNGVCYCFIWLKNRVCYCFTWLKNRLFPFRPRLRGTVTGTTPGCLTRFKNGVCYCFIWLKNRLGPFRRWLQNCFMACFMGLAHRFGLLCWYIAGLFRR